MSDDHPEMLLRSKFLTYHQQHGEVFAYHNYFGYLLGMSRDLVDLLEFHTIQLRTHEEVVERFGDQFEKEQLDEFITVFKLFSCLIDSELAEERSLWVMVPARSRWVVFHQPSPDQLSFWRTGPDDESVAEPTEPWAARLWAAVDGETKLEDIMATLWEDPSLAQIESPRKHVIRTLTGWVHHSRQYLKFAKAPLSKYGKEHQWPSYLRSTMPYPVWIPGRDPEPVNPLEAVATPINPPHEYYESEVSDAEEQFRNVETTLSHLFRSASPLLEGRSYSERVADSLIERGMLTDQTRVVVEVGAGMGHFAAGVLGRLRERDPAVFEQISYRIVDLSPTLREQQAALLAERGLADKVTWTAANAEELELEDDSVDLLLSNEVIGDFTTVKLTRKLLGLDQSMDPKEAMASWSEKTAEMLGESGRLLRTYELMVRDAPDEFYFNVGALRFLERAHRMLRPGGAAFITEYGDLTKYPIASTQLDHIEFSIQFGHLAQLLRGLGAKVEVEYVQDLIKLDRNARTLATTRTYYKSLRAMLASFGMELDKQAWSMDMFIALLDVRVQLGHIGDVRFEIVDERCMGLSPHEFKALLIRK